MEDRVAQDEIEITTEHSERLPVELLALSHQRQSAGAINLCQGNFAAGPAKKSALAPWRPLILVAAAWLVFANFRCSICNFPLATRKPCDGSGHPFGTGVRVGVAAL